MSKTISFVKTEGYRLFSGSDPVMADPVMTVATFVTVKTAITVPHVTMIFVNPARAIAGCAMRRFVWAVQVSVTAVKN